MKGIVAALVIGLLPGSAYGQTLNLYGNAGLIDMPTADTLPDGTIAFSYGAFDGSGRATINFQIAPRLEGSYRYSAIDGFGTPGLEQSDEQVDFKFTLVRETESLPGVAIGIRDFLGNATYSSEYLVATKEVYPGLRVTGGLGWGRLAGRDAFENPFGGTRDNPGGGRQRVNTGNFFAGDDIGVFGGLAYSAPESPWTFKLEYSSDTYDQEVAGGGFTQETPWNVGIEREIMAGVDVGAYWMHGSEFGLRLSFTADPREPRTKQDLFSAPPVFFARPKGGDRGTGWTGKQEYHAQLVGALAKALGEEGIRLEAADLGATEAEVQISNLTYSRQAKAVGRTARILALALPHSVETMKVTVVENHLPVTTVTIPRSEFERLIDTHEAVPESWQNFRIGNAEQLTDPVYRRDPYPKLSYGIAPRVPFSVFGDGFNFDLKIAVDAEYRLSPNFALSGEVTQSLLGRLSDTTTTRTALPQVRSNFPDFEQKTPVVERLTADYITKTAPDLYTRVSAGYLERMYGGVSGEVLYKDAADPVAYGLELNWARQREPDTLLGFNGYDAVTGHASIYWETPWDGVLAQVDAGRYLAGDWGATVTLTRRFLNGWEVAGYVTATDGDTTGLRSGEFDQGLRLTIPLQWTYPAATRRTLTVPFQTLGRDDGARLEVENRLYPLVRNVDKARLGENWGAFWQ